MAIATAFTSLIVPPSPQPSPASGRGAGVRAGGGNSDSLHFVDTPALTPTLSRKRERGGGEGRR
ncbi:hypothetical protein CBM2629_B40116 [Cupriavidus taiwanensis]|nr:hypothetical protein CBM2629_B40116 [Cupriavidus taiwanensis]